MAVRIYTENEIACFAINLPRLPFLAKPFIKYCCSLHVSVNIDRITATITDINLTVISSLINSSVFENDYFCIGSTSSAPLNIIYIGPKRSMLSFESLMQISLIALPGIIPNSGVKLTFHHCLHKAVTTSVF